MAEQNGGFKLEEGVLKAGALVLRALNHKLRQQMLQLIHKKGQITVTEIYVKLRLEQSVASQHLRILRDAHLVTTEREGKQIFYSLDYKRLDYVQGICAKLVQKA
jgi:DNA-binding transcriptional ArsR family regulator